MLHATGLQIRPDPAAVRGKRLHFHGTRAAMTDEPRVWIIDCEQWPRAYLRAELIERGYEAVGFVDLTHALTAMRRSYTTRPSLIVLELRGAAPQHDDLDALAHSGIPTIVLGGTMELSEDVVQSHAWTVVLCRPFTIGAVADMVEETLAPEEGKKMGPTRFE
jgi:hypothetical protein